MKAIPDAALLRRSLLLSGSQSYKMEGTSRTAGHCKKPASVIGTLDRHARFSGYAPSPAMRQALSRAFMLQ
ncbi:hypothetical protein ACFQI7_22160 [Paenibacillus allorhizosphaerae]|uniref:hypothetical protein n=1 Tax=Paenibacillus allorhizosphaerae TaxID=2849866 RepID=UPI001C4046FA|nr:hypothetical protein [Paenibacillus allorhizosphaerae]